MHFPITHLCLRQLTGAQCMSFSLALCTLLRCVGKWKKSPTHFLFRNYMEKSGKLHACVVLTRRNIFMWPLNRRPGVGERGSELLKEQGRKLRGGRGCKCCSNIGRRGATTHIWVYLASKNVKLLRQMAENWVNNCDFFKVVVSAKGCYIKPRTGRQTT